LTLITLGYPLLGIWKGFFLVFTGYNLSFDCITMKNGSFFPLRKKIILVTAIFKSSTLLVRGELSEEQETGG
jgi:hypothetical protein